MRTPTRKDRDPLYDEIEAQLQAEAERQGEEDPRELPMLAIVGRPNVGKSTLFNRIIGRRKAVVHDKPGVTRDRNIEVAHWDGLSFLTVDTGGFETELDDPLLAEVVEQVRLAIDEADVIVLLLATGEDAHPADDEMVRLLRGTSKPVFVAVNKADNPKLAMAANEFYRYGFDMIHPVSALHGIGVADMLSEAVVAMKTIEKPAHLHDPGMIKLALVGRQNVGKSTLLNMLAGERRVIASPVAGTTRDSIDMIVKTPDGRKFTLVDTAGIRRRGKVEKGIEKLSVLSSMVSMRRADVAAILIDAEQGITDQDSHIAGYCLDNGMAVIIVVNKWDLYPEKDHKSADKFTQMLYDRWKFLRYAPVLYVSALSGQRANRVFDVAERVYANASRRVPTPKLNELMQEWVEVRPPMTKHVRKPKVKFMTQTGIHPPTFTLFVNDPVLFHFTYQRYIMNRLREAYDFEGTPIRLNIRRSGGQRRNRAEDELQAAEGAPMPPQGVRSYEIDEEE